MQIAVASGKGGTGKTTVAVNLALVRGNVQLLDCDAEDPDALLFLRPKIRSELPIVTSVPRVDEEVCLHCGACGDVCAYGAITALRERWFVTPSLCNDCGACYRVCPTDALEPEPRRIGSITHGELNGLLDVFSGALDPGEATATPIIDRLRSMATGDRTTIIDAPPGTACPLIHAIDGVDLCLMVTEPTPYGYHDLEQALDVADEMGVPCAAVINRCDLGDADVQSLCERRGVPILLVIPFDEGLARAYARGLPAVKADSRWQEVFAGLWNRIEGVLERNRDTTFPVAKGVRS